VRFPVRIFLLSTLAVAALAGASFIATPPGAHAQEASHIGSTQAATITSTQFDEALADARDRGMVTSEATDGDGALTTTVDLGQGYSIDFVEAPSSRLSAGSDGYGKYVSLNNFDQDAVISGGLFGVSAGLCVVSAGVFCVVAGAVLTAAGLALAANNNQKCSGGRALRVYPFSGHAPRCA
jgi:hypothetical protein